MPVRMTGMISGLDTDTLIKSLVDAQRLKNKKVEDKKTLLEWKQDRWKELNAKLYKLYTTDLNKMRLESSYLTKTITSSNEDLVSVNAKANAPTGTHELVINQLASSQSLTGGEITEATDSGTKLMDLGVTKGNVISIQHNGEKYELIVDEEKTIADVVNLAKKAGLNASFDENYKRLYISSKNSGTANTFEITATTEAELDIIGLGSTAKPVNAVDSQITYDGVTYTGSTNVFNINGMEITLKGKGTGETIYLNVEANTKGIYDMVKNFVFSYNDILKEMNDLYYAESARGYDPLSDDEKEAMTDEQIEKWEKKIKDSILRRDSTLGSLLDSMKNAMLTSVDMDGKRYSLSSYGIHTSTVYTEKGLLHIDGNEDDALFSASENKLMKALEEDPDTVMNVLTQVSQKLYDTMNEKMKAIPNVRSAFTFYNDKEMANQKTDYEKQIAKLEAKVVEMEEKYYKQFAAMESAMAKMQEQSNALAGMLGLNTK